MFNKNKQTRQNKWCTLHKRYIKINTLFMANTRLATFVLIHNLLRVFQYPSDYTNQIRSNSPMSDDSITFVTSEKFHIGHIRIISHLSHERNFRFVTSEKFQVCNIRIISHLSNHPFSNMFFKSSKIFSTHVLLFKHLSNISALSNSVFPSLTMSTFAKHLLYRLYLK